MLVNILEKCTEDYPDIIIKEPNYHYEAQTWSEAAQMGQNGTKSAQTEHKTTNILGIFFRLLY